MSQLAPHLDPYALLGATPQTSVADLRKAYYAMALLLHPDRGGRAEDMRVLTAAYEFVKRELEFGSTRPLDEATLRDLEAEFASFFAASSAATASMPEVYDEARGPDDLELKELKKELDSLVVDGHFALPIDPHTALLIPREHLDLVKGKFDAGAFNAAFETAKASAALNGDNSGYDDSGYEAGYELEVPRITAADLTETGERKSEATLEESSADFKPLELGAYHPPRSGLDFPDALSAARLAHPAGPRNYQFDTGASGKKLGVAGGDYREATSQHASLYAPEPEAGYEPLPDLREVQRERERVDAQIYTETSALA